MTSKVITILGLLILKHAWLPIFIICGLLERLPVLVLFLIYADFVEFLLLFPSQKYYVASGLSRMLGLHPLYVGFFFFFGMVGGGINICY